jgi:hypothetical protein
MLIIVNISIFGEVDLFIGVKQMIVWVWWLRSIVLMGHWLTVYFVIAILCHWIYIHFVYLKLIVIFLVAWLFLLFVILRVCASIVSPILYVLILSLLNYLFIVHLILFLLNINSFIYFCRALFACIALNKTLIFLNFNIEFLQKSQVI